MNNNRSIVPVIPHGGRGVGGNGGGSVSNRMMTSNTTATNHHPNRRPGTNSTRPGTASSSRIMPPSLMCNLCQKPLATTCFLCACDCIFCEECTYSHFEQSSQCPICQKTLNENDFTELVVADATANSTSDITKTSLQALFSKQSKSSSHNLKGLPYSDLCFSIIRQIDVVKQSTRFLLKQLLMNSNGQTRKVAVVLRHNEKLKSDITSLKQGHSTQRIQYEQINNDLKNRLSARESKIQELNAKLAEKERMLEQFRRLHGGKVNTSGIENDRDGGSKGQGYHHPIPSSINGRSGGSISGSMSGNTHGGGGIMERHRNRHQHHNNNQISSGNSIASSAAEPPLKGLMMQRQAHQMAQQQAFASRRGPIVPAASSGMNRMGQQQQNQHSMGPPSAPNYSRPYSSNNSISSNSLSSTTPRIRDLSHNTAFNFTGGSGNSISGNSGGGMGQQRLNKRRKSDHHSATPLSHSMSPNTAFTLNQGTHTVNRGPRWMQRDGGNYSRG